MQTRQCVNHTMLALPPPPAHQATAARVLMSGVCGMNECLPACLINQTPVAVKVWQQGTHSLSSLLKSIPAFVMVTLSGTTKPAQASNCMWQWLHGEQSTSKESTTASKPLARITRGATTTNHAAGPSAADMRVHHTLRPLCHRILESSNGDAKLTWSQ
jgi:hypothetical protein